ncbi:MAG: resolvase [Chthonomonadetes bacterium]|nr:resolvase [Chthonomonadetes bacterium]
MSSSGKPYVLAIDPGRSKMGLAVVCNDGQILYRAVLELDEFVQEMVALYQRFRPKCIVIGGGTGSREMEPMLRQFMPGVQVHVVDEAYTSEEARRRYLRENPPKGWRRLIPPFLRVPDRPYDDYVAIILAERYWSTVNREKQQS